MRSFGRIFAQGFLTLLPILFTIYLLTSVISLLESSSQTLLKFLLPEGWTIPGLGILVSLSLIYFLGLLLNYYITRNIIQGLEKKILKIPFIKAIYSPLRDIVQLFSQKDQTFGSPVWVDLGFNNIKAFGLVTRDTFEDIQSNTPWFKTGQYVTVFIPLSYQLGGYTILVPKENIAPLDIPVEKAMSYAITGWIRPKTEHKE